MIGGPELHDVLALTVTCGSCGAVSTVGDCDVLGAKDGYVWCSECFEPVLIPDLPLGPLFGGPELQRAT